MQGVRVDVLVSAVLARANRPFVRAVLERRGDADRGAILVRINGEDGTARVESRLLDPERGYVWSRIHEAEWISSGAADDLVQRRISYDVDSWVIAVDGGENPFVGFEGDV